jgi:hypothetical protein
MVRGRRRPGVRRFAFAPAAWLAFLVIVLLHEVGHALVVRALRHRVVALEVTGFGGLCRWSGAATPLERSLIAWGGVLAQAVLLIVALVVFALGGFRVVPFGGELAYTFVWTNLWLIGLNLLPFAPLDGAEAWRLFPELGRWRRSRLDARAGRALLEQILARPAPPRPPRVPPRGASRGRCACGAQGSPRRPGAGLGQGSERCVIQPRASRSAAAGRGRGRARASRSRALTRSAVRDGMVVAIQLALA